MAVIQAAWERYDSMTAPELAETLQKIGLHANPEARQKRPRSPEPSAKKGDVSGAVARRHVATGRVLENGLVN